MRTQTFNISLPKELVNKIDERAKREYKNRSELIKDSLQKYLKDKEEWDRIFDYGKRTAKRMGIKSEEDVYRIVDEYRHGK